MFSYFIHESLQYLKTESTNPYLNPLTNQVFFFKSTSVLYIYPFSSLKLKPFTVNGRIYLLFYFDFADMEFDYQVSGKVVLSFNIYL